MLLRAFFVTVMVIYAIATLSLMANHKKMVSEGKGNMFPYGLAIVFIPFLTALLALTGKKYGW